MSGWRSTCPDALGTVLETSDLSVRDCAVRRSPKNPSPDERRQVGLKDIASHVRLSKATVSYILSGSPGARSIPEKTKQRVLAAARELNYRPNFVARSLQSQRTYAIGVLVPEFSDGYSALVLNGIEERVRENGYLCLVTSHGRKAEALEQYPQMLFDRRVEGLIAVDTPYAQTLPFPVVSVSGHDRVPGVTYVVLNHDTAADLALQHLVELGHKRIAFIRGQSFTADATTRWNSIKVAAKKWNIEIDPALVAQLDENSPSPLVGYRAAAKILANATQPFTALFAFNDVSAIGAIKALHEAGLTVPRDVSLMGFDDIMAAAFQLPALTTIRQPLAQMGRLAADVLLKRISKSDSQPQIVQVEPELVIRESTGPAPRAALSSVKGTRATEATSYSRG
jgi:DNA-binding LacI/PurR family transcriptional regulator